MTNQSDHVVLPRAKLEELIGRYVDHDAANVRDPGLSREFEDLLAAAKPVHLSARAKSSRWYALYALPNMKPMGYRLEADLYWPKPEAACLIYIAADAAEERE